MLPMFEEFLIVFEIVSKRLDMVEFYKKNVA